MCRPMIVIVAIVIAGLVAGTTRADDSLDKKLLLSMNTPPGGDMALIRSLIAQGANVNAKNELGVSPLHMAPTPEVAELLIAQGAEVNGRDRSASTPLHLAVSVNRKDVAQLLIAKGADVNARDGSGATPLQRAEARNEKDVAALLIAKGAH